MLVFDNAYSLQNHLQELRGNIFRSRLLWTQGLYLTKFRNVVVQSRKRLALLELGGFLMGNGPNLDAFFNFLV